MTQWHPIDARYEVSTEGRVRHTGGVELGQWATNDGYMRVRLSRPRRLLDVHRLVAKTFIPNPDGKRVVNHINNDPSDNRVANLEWCTQRENLEHSARQGRSPRCTTCNRFIGLKRRTSGLCAQCALLTKARPLINQSGLPLAASLPANSDRGMGS